MTELEYLEMEYNNYSDMIEDIEDEYDRMEMQGYLFEIEDAMRDLEY